MEKVAVWTFYVTVIAVVVSLSYATLHLVRGTATRADLVQLESKMDKGFARLESLLVDKKLDAKQDMINHISTAHVNKP